MSKDFNPKIVPVKDLTDSAFGTGTARSQICSSCRVGFIYTRQVKLTGGRWFVVGECGQCQHVEPRYLNGRDLIAVGDAPFPSLISISSDRVGIHLKKALHQLEVAPEASVPA